MPRLCACEDGSTTRDFKLHGLITNMFQLFRGTTAINLPECFDFKMVAFIVTHCLEANIDFCVVQLVKSLFYVQSVLQTVTAVQGTSVAVHFPSMVAITMTILEKLFRVMQYSCKRTQWNWMGSLLFHYQMLYILN